jgi:hypothetical protein
VIKIVPHSDKYCEKHMNEVKNDRVFLVSVGNRKQQKVRKYAIKTVI